MHRRTTRWAASSALVLGLLLAGCASPDQEGPMATGSPKPLPSTPTAPASAHPTLSPPPVLPLPSSALPTGPVSDDVVRRADVQAALRAEAERRGVRSDQVEVAGFAQVTWPDGSIGCPQPGMMYTQALVPGKQLILRVGDQLASYHAGGDAAFAFCENPTAPLPAEADPNR